MLASYNSYYGGVPNRNFLEYDEYLRSLEKANVTDEDRYDAVRHTWFGRIMTDLGFTEPQFILDIRDSSGTEAIVSAKFSKPKEPQREKGESSA